MVVNPITMTPDQTLAEALELMKANRISGIPIVEKSGKLCGILTNRDVRFAENPKQPVSELMTRENLADRRRSARARRTRSGSSTSGASRSCWSSTTAIIWSG